MHREWSGSFISNCMEYVSVSLLKLSTIQDTLENVISTSFNQLLK